MFELEIDGTVYQFSFNIGFVREINKTQKYKDPDSGVVQDAGLAYAITQVINGDILTLVDVLDLANKRYTPRVTRRQIEDYLDDESTDVDALFEEVLDFFGKANATKKVTRVLTEAVEEQKNKK